MSGESLDRDRLPDTSERRGSTPKPRLPAQSGLFHFRRAALTPHLPLLRVLSPAPIQRSSTRCVAGLPSRAAAVRVRMIAPDDETTMLETQPIPLEQLKAQRDKTHEELCRLEWLICQEQNRQADAMRLQRDAAMKHLQGGTGQPPAWQFQPVNDGRLNVQLTHSYALPKTYTG